MGADLRFEGFQVGASRGVPVAAVGAGRGEGESQMEKTLILKQVEAVNIKRQEGDRIVLFGLTEDGRVYEYGDQGQVWRPVSMDVAE